MLKLQCQMLLSVMILTGLPHHQNTTANSRPIAPNVSELAIGTERTIYVDQASPGPQSDGVSWKTAFKTLQAGLAAANDGPWPAEVRVAQGVYLPLSVDLRTGSCPSSTFQLPKNTAILGGFRGWDEGHEFPDEREIENFRTVLSGDVDCRREVWHEHGVRHVVTAEDVNDSVLDGFQIEAGGVLGFFRSDQRGGGLLCKNASPIIRRCTFIDNDTRGDVWYSDYDPKAQGGAVYIDGASSPRFTFCRFTKNSAAYGGAVYSNGAQNLLFENCLFANNHASTSGGAIYLLDSSVTIVNCTMAENTAQAAKALAYEFSQTPQESAICVTNSILWNGGTEISPSQSPLIEISYSCIQGNDPDDTITYGIGNIDVDPRFVSLAYWGLDSDTRIPVSAANLNGTYVEGNYHLRADSSCVDAGDPEFAWNTIAVGLDGHTRIVDDRVDMGAYEFQNRNVDD